MAPTPKSKARRKAPREGMPTSVPRKLTCGSTHDEKTSGFYRALNEVPTVLMIGIVILVIVKPF